MCDWTSTVLSKGKTSLRSDVLEANQPRRQAEQEHRACRNSVRNDSLIALSTIFSMLESMCLASITASILCISMNESKEVEFKKND